jgi:hypothetical protein
VVKNILVDGMRAGLELTADRKKANMRSTYALFVEVNTRGQIRRIREYYDTNMITRQLGLGSE